MKLALLAMTGIFLMFDGCEQTAPHVAAKPGYQRFVLNQDSYMVSGIPYHAALALDTKTGLLCQTFPLPSTNAWSNLPKCFDLYKQYPD